MTSIHAAVMLVRWCGKGNLMDLRVNQLQSTGAGAKHLVGITSIFMTLLSITSMVSMKVSSHIHSPIPHFLLALIFFWHSKPPCRKHSVLYSEASIPLLVSILSLFLTCFVPLAYSSLDQNVGFPLWPLPCCNSTMTREQGNPKRGMAYYKFIARCNRPDPLC
jgi:hypothetical protein